MLGEVPIRDFMAYDPGRYYFSAWLMKLWADDGIVSLRLAISVIKFVAVFVALSVLVSNTEKQSLLFVILSAVILALWIIHYDQLSPVILLACVTYLLNNPCGRRYFILGLWVGFAAVIGRNHGVYGLVTSFLTIVYIRIRSDDPTAVYKGAIIWGSGIAIGYLPIIAMLMVVPDFALPFWKSILFLFELKATNLPVPIPWPWLFDFGQPFSGEALRSLLLGLLILFITIFSVVGLFLAYFRKITYKHNYPILVSSIFTTTAYLHYVYSRADTPHLHNVMPPLVIGCIALFTYRPNAIKWTALILLLGASLFQTLPSYPRFNCVGSGGNCTDMGIGKDRIFVPKRVANDLAFVKNLSDKYVTQDQHFLVVPFWPGVYPALNYRNPMRELYALLPQNRTYQLAEIERLKDANVRFVLIIDIELDGSSDTLYRNTHPLIHDYIEDNFDRVTNHPEHLPYGYRLYLPKN